MKYSKATDLLIHSIVPVLLGYFFYILSENDGVPVIIRNYLPDGLWAYGFISCILIVWDRKPNLFWIAITFLISLLFELFQYWHIIAGTGDVWDVVVYFLFFMLALKINQTHIYTHYYEKF